MCVTVLSVCVHAWCLWKSEGIRSPRTDHEHKLPHGCWELYLSPLQEQEMMLSAELSSLLPSTPSLYKKSGWGGGEGRREGGREEGRKMKKHKEKDPQ